MEKINIIVEDGLAIKDHTGPGQYSIMIIEGLKAMGYNPIIPKKYFLEKIKNANLRRILYLLWLNSLFFIRLLFAAKNTIVVYTNYSMPFIKLPHIKQYPVVHDLCSYLYPQTMTNIQNFYSKRTTDNAIKNGNKIITVSSTVKKEIINEFKIESDKIVVINCINTLLLSNKITSGSSDILQKLDLANQDYIMSVSTFNMRKNVMMLIDAFNCLSSKFPDLKLVLVGRNGNDKKIQSIKSQNKNIIFSGFVSDDELSILYKNAKVYIFPSLYEGFGIPIIDAQNFGVPVLCSDIPIFREIANDGAYFANLTKEDFAKGIEVLLHSDTLRQDMIEKGERNCIKYSIQNIKEQIVKGLNIDKNNPELEKVLINKGFERVKDFSFNKFSEKLTEFYSKL